jgi:hypothetical protein
MSSHDGPVELSVKDQQYPKTVAGAVVGRDKTVNNGQQRCPTDKPNLQLVSRNRP